MDEFWRFAQQPLVGDYAGRVLGAAVILAVGWLAIRFLVSPLRRVLERSRADPSVASFLANSARSALIIVVVLGMLHQLGVQTASLLTLLGACALAIALSLQGSLANFASGLLILSFRMVRVGDLIEIGDVRGRATELLPFHVVLVTLDNQRITVPNTSLTNGPVRNHTALLIRRASWTLPLLPQDDLPAVKQALLIKLQGDPRILREPAPQMYVQEWAADKRVLAINAWTNTADYQAVQLETLEGLGQALDELRKSAAGSPASRP